MIRYSSDSHGHEIEIRGLFYETFSEAAGTDEGAEVAALAEEILRSTDPSDVRVELALEGNRIIGAILFTPMTFGGDSRRVRLLSPVAVMPELQGRGVGQGLIRYGLDRLRDEAVDVVVTYGDPRFYAQVGFEQISSETVPPPYLLSQPEGWLAQSLIGGPIAPFEDRGRCVAAFRRPGLW